MPAGKSECHPWEAPAPGLCPCQGAGPPFRLNVQSNRRGHRVHHAGQHRPTARGPRGSHRRAGENLRRTPAGIAAHGHRGGRSLAGGVTSSWQITAPQPVWLSHGRGSKIYDVDGNEYVDLHGGYGVGLAGHAHPAIVEAVTRQVALGTHFAQPTQDAVVVAGELAARFGLPLWRFANSGTEATMDAVHLMRAITGRDLIIKIEGCYHGHHDSVQVSVAPRGRRGRPGGQARPGPVEHRHPRPVHQADPGRQLQRHRQRRQAAGRAPGRDRRDDHRADHDERRDHPPRARVPGGAEGPAALPRRPAHVRRGQDRPDRGPGRGHRADRRGARHHLPGQGDRRRGRRSPPSAARPR